MNEDLKFGLIFGSGAIILVAIVSLLSIMAEAKQCLKSYENFSPQWGIWSGCRILVNGKLTPVDIVRELK